MGRDDAVIAGDLAFRGSGVSRQPQELPSDEEYEADGCALPSLHRCWRSRRRMIRRRENRCGKIQRNKIKIFRLSDMPVITIYP